MSPRFARCPGCAARIAFDRPGAILVVCEHCRLASWRTDVALERIGQVAELAPIESPIALRAEGVLDGKRFRVAGVVELDHGRGPWHEWAIRFEDDAWAWIAEAQGQYLVTRPVDVDRKTVPQHSKLEAGTEVDLGAHGLWVVTERGRGKVTTLAGELPERIEVRTERRYADVAGPEAGFGTLDFGAGDDCESVYLGRRVALADLGFAGDPGPKKERKAHAMGIKCPKCAGSIQLADPTGVERLGCPYCDAMLAPDSEGAKAVGINRRVQSKPKIPLGARGKFQGREYQVLAYLVRSVSAEGVRYPWDEYLLRRDDGEYRWFVCSQGHWTFVEPANLADVKQKGGALHYKGERFRHFTSGKAVVDLVLGEVYWEIEVGETVACADYVAPPRMLSTEGTKDERTVSLAHHVEAGAIEKAFALGSPLPRARSIGMVQPNPHPAMAKSLWRAWAVLALLLFAAGGWFLATSEREVAFRGVFPLDRAATDNGLLSDEFELTPRFANARLVLAAEGLPEGRFGCDGALVESATGARHRFSIAPRETSPTELGNTRGECEFTWGTLPAGRYRVRLEPRGMTPGATLEASVVSQQPHPLWAFVLALLLAVPPLLWLLFAGGFESGRWMQSDHA